MSSARILPNDPSDFPSMPSMPTLRVGGDANALGRIDHYDLLRKLGGGGFGVVYLALDTASGVEVALKTLHPLLKSNAEEMDVLREKFRLVSRLSHPNIASALVLHPVRDVNIWDETARKEMRLFPGDSVMVMRYAPGTTLSKWRRQFPDGIVPLDQALDIARQIASALDYAHGERIVHRDIKPANIMVETLTTDGGEPPNPRHRVRILDFGLAAEIRSSMSRVSTEQGDTSGTRPYMAPEQWLGKKQDGRTDQYALACVLYELLSGAPPFAGVFETGDPAIMMAAVKGEAPDEIEDVPAHVNTALLRALAKAPKDRFPSCAALVEAVAGGANSPSEPRRRERVSHAENAEKGRACSPSEPQDAADLEADVLRRKAALSSLLAEISEDERKDDEIRHLISEAETVVTAADEAVQLGRFTAAAQCLNHSETISQRFSHVRKQRKKPWKSLLLTTILTCISVGFLLLFNFIIGGDDVLLISLVIVFPMISFPLIEFLKSVCRGTVESFPKRIGFTYGFLILLVLFLNFLLFLFEANKNCAVIILVTVEITYCIISDWKVFR